MLIPKLPNITLFDEGVIMDRTSFPHNGLGEPKLTTVESIKNEQQLQMCMYHILNNNPGVSIHHVQYLALEKKVRFYASTKLDTSKWDNFWDEYKKIEARKERVIFLLQYINSNKQQCPTNSVTINEIIQAIDSLERKRLAILQKFQNIILDVERKDDQASDDVTITCDYKLNHLIIEITTFYNGKPNSTRAHSFKIENNDCSLQETTLTPNNSSILEKFGKIVIACFNELKAFEDFINSSEILYIQNSLFNFEIKQQSCTLTEFDFSTFKMTDILRLVYHPNSQQCEINCESSNIINLIKENGDCFRNSLFVSIDHLPIWLKNEIEELRKPVLQEAQLPKINMSGRAGSFFRNTGSALSRLLSPRLWKRETLPIVDTTFNDNNGEIKRKSNFEEVALKLKSFSFTENVNAHNFYSYGWDLLDILSSLSNSNIINNMHTKQNEIEEKISHDLDLLRNQINGQDFKLTSEDVKELEFYLNELYVLQDLLENYYLPLINELITRIKNFDYKTTNKKVSDFNYGNKLTTLSVNITATETLVAALKIEAFEQSMENAIRLFSLKTTANINQILNRNNSKQQPVIDGESRRRDITNLKNLIKVPASVKCANYVFPTSIKPVPTRKRYRSMPH